jgi:nucleotidyltransferase/DNA polymerase involved in DNA repair
MAKPDGPVVVDPGIELEFLHHLPIELMWGVGPVTGARLAEIGVLTIGAAGKDAGMVARAVARSRGGRETRSAGVEPRPTGNRDASPTPIGRSAVGDRQVFPTHPCFMLQTESAPASGPGPSLVAL